MSRIIIELDGSDRFGAPLYVCFRERGGLMGSGHSSEMALADFLDKENELTATQEERETEEAIDAALEADRHEALLEDTQEQYRGN